MKPTTLTDKRRLDRNYKTRFKIRKFEAKY